MEQEIFPNFNFFTTSLNWPELAAMASDSDHRADFLAHADSFAVVDGCRYCAGVVWGDLGLEGNVSPDITSCGF